MLNAAALLAFATPAGAEVVTATITDGTITQFINTYDTKYGGIYAAGESNNTYTLSTNSISIQNTQTGAGRAVQTKTGGSITLGGQNTQSVTLKSNDYAAIALGGNIDIIADSINIQSDTGGIHAGHNAQINLTGGDISIVSTPSSINNENAMGIVAMSGGKVNITGNTTIDAKRAILTRGGSVTNINAAGNYTTIIKGNIVFDYDEETSKDSIDATVNINLDSETSYWTGNVAYAWEAGSKPDSNTLRVSNASVTLNNGATWNATAIDNQTGSNSNQIALNNLTVNKGTINVDSGATAMVENATINGDLTLNGTLTTVKDGTINFAKGSTLTTTLDSTAKFAGNGEVTGTINLTAPTTGTFAFVSDSVNVGNLSFNNGLYNIEWTDDSKTDIKITEKETSEVVDEITSNTNASTQEANAVVSLISAEGTGTEKGQLIASVISEAMQSGNTSLAVDTAKKAAPTTSQMVVGIAKEAAKTMARVAGTRMDAISGRAGGDVMEGAGLWMQALYNHTKQDATSSSDGFKANSRGLAIGVDKKVSDTTTLGFGYGYMNTDADSYGRELEVDGHNFFIYGKYQPSKWYVSSVLNYNYSKYTEKKTPLGIALRSEYDVNSYGVQLMTGYDMDNGLTPEMGLRYLDVDADSYQDGMQRIRSNHDDVLTAVAGIKYTTDVKTKDVIFKPTARLSATYDVISDNSRANVSVIGGNNYAIDGKRLHRFGVEAGAGVTASVDNIDITLEYTGAFRQDYKSQGGMLKARYNF